MLGSGPLRPDRSSIGLATGGIIIGHALGYALAYPVGALRAEHLAATGHGSFPVIAVLALLSAGASLVIVGARALRQDLDLGTAATAVRLARVQVPAFLLLELAERGLDPARTLADPGVRLGLLMQALVALGIALFLRSFVRAVRVIAGAPRPRRPRSNVIPLEVPTEIGPARPPRHVGTHRRAPPHPLVSERC